MMTLQGKWILNRKKTEGVDHESKRENHLVKRIIRENIMLCVASRLKILTLYRIISTHNELCENVGQSKLER